MPNPNCGGGPRNKKSELGTIPCTPYSVYRLVFWVKRGIIFWCLPRSKACWAARGHSHVPQLKLVGFFRGLLLDPSNGDFSEALEFEALEIISKILLQANYYKIVCNGLIQQYDSRVMCPIHRPNPFV